MASICTLECCFSDDNKRATQWLKIILYLKRKILPWQCLRIIIHVGDEEFSYKCCHEMLGSRAWIHQDNHPVQYQSTDLIRRSVVDWQNPRLLGEPHWSPSLTPPFVKKNFTIILRSNITSCILATV